MHLSRDHRDAPAFLAEIAVRGASLPVLGPIVPRELARFDAVVTGPLGLRVLRDELGILGAMRVVAAIAKRAMFRDPMRALPPVRDVRDQLTRQQLRPVLLLDAVLRDDLKLDDARASAVLRKVVLTSGAAFLAHFMPSLTFAEWSTADAPTRERFVIGLLSRFFNAEIHRWNTEPAALHFDVARCRFVELLALLGRSELGHLFCAVDERFASNPAAGIDLTRSGTLATGAALCDFRIRLRAIDP